MAKSFVFDPPSDEEFDHSDAEEEEDEEQEEREEEQGGKGEEDEPLSRRRTESPWDFASYSESVAEEHARRSTTSVDFKISKLLEKRSSNVTPTAADDDESSEEESDRQEDYRPEDDDDGTSNACEGKSFFAPSDGASFHANSFMELNLSRPLIRACEALGYAKPTPIQAACIPLALTGRDICGSAITGSGKTAAFSLPTLERLLYRPKRDRAIRVLILTPARELAIQVHSMIEKLAQFTDIRCCLIVGGLSRKEQEAALRSMPDVVVATPGRMIDHLRNSMSVDLDDLAVLILDEADRLLELGFSAEIRELVRLCPKRRQTMLFSATMTEEIDELIKLSLTKPLRLSADPATKRPKTLTEEVVRLRRMREVNQEAVLLALCSKTFTSKAIIFSGTKQAAHRLKILFGLAGFKAAELHGNLTQVQRLDALELFRKQQVDYLIATDVAARGLDIIGVQTVINFACPRDLTSYVHRVGRTARAGREGYAVTFVTDNDRSLLKAIAENMIVHQEEIFSRPKKTWFITDKEKKLVAKAAKTSLEKGKTSGNEVVSAQHAEDLKMKEKRKREREKNLPRKKRRKLEAAREMLEEEKQNGKTGVWGENKKDKSGLSLVKLAYRRAKAVKAVNKALDSGKIVKQNQKTKKSSHRTQSRSEEMREMFQYDMSEQKQKRRGSGGAGMKKSKHSFKSKSRYKRK
ncbi:DEAD-box ATP-dependent RNA helicase 28 isoform X3 [Cucurbita moschata]|uniref:DEAD-box ATP-dependent RNA helicase 28 isoform X3 n=1 Tax=Cucurbita moschata TaxID=3662 RepID=A0A6J1F9Y6_CUCMO|nr:DEAD-box ATP-dependent RNA helicase 28 isoform X3 [Cucurbita moschata]